MKIFVARHGQTESNKLGKLMGQIDESLNSQGIEQAKGLADKINIGDFDIIMVSPLKRAKETAAIINEKIKLPTIENEKIMERNFGSLSVMKWSDMPGGLEMKTIDRAQKYDYRPYGGESAEEVKNRVMNFLDELRVKYSDKKVLVVAHAGILKMINFIVTGNTIDTPDNAAILEFEI